MNINFHSNPKPFSKKKKIQKPLLISIIVVLILILGSASFAMFKITRTDKSSSSVSSDKNSGIASDLNNQTKVAEPPKPVLKASPINGIKLEESAFNAISSRPVLAVMIQNNSASRPEWGLDQADVVYETLAEGGITRFMGVFWSQDAEKLQSVRSARKYFVDLLGDYNNPAYMHIGYSDGAENVSALAALGRYKIRDLGNLGGAFDRDRACEKIRAVEHCAFSSTSTLWSLATKSKWTSDIAALQPWKFKDSSVADESIGKEVTSFTTNFSSLYSADYSVNWKYDKASNKYLRFNVNNTPYTLGSGKQVDTDTVIYQKINSLYSGDSHGHMIQDVIGSGTGYIMQGGKSYNVTWKKPNFATRTKFYDATTGNEFTFNRGRLWIMLVAKGNEIVDNTPKPTAIPTLAPTKQP